MGKFYRCRPTHGIPGRARGQCVLVVWWWNDTIGRSRLVASFRSAYGIRIVGVGVLDDPSVKFDLDGQIFPLPMHALRMKFVENPRFCEPGIFCRYVGTKCRGRPGCRPVCRKSPSVWNAAVSRETAAIFSHTSPFPANNTIVPHYTGRKDGHESNRHRPAGGGMCYNRANRKSRV